MIFLDYLEKQSQSFKLLLGFALIGAIGILDLLTGYELSLSLFYVIPISFLTWSIGRQSGLIASLISASAWLVADLASGHVYSNPLFPIWNTLIRLSFFVIIALLLSALSKAMKREQELARTDPLTGAMNGRQFFGLLQIEIERQRRYRHPFTLVYLDLDNFKTINDQYGHHTGDQVLRLVVATAKQQLRSTDVIARLGGDEFAVLFPETDQAAAKVAVNKFQNAWAAVLAKFAWQATCSMGALTVDADESSAEELVKKADGLMYQVKRQQKNAILFDKA